MKKTSLSERIWLAFKGTEPNQVLFRSKKFMGYDLLLKPSNKLVFVSENVKM